MRISDWSSDVCSSDLLISLNTLHFAGIGKTRIGTDNLHSLSGQPVAHILVRTADQQGTRELPGDIPKPVEQLIRHIAVKEIMGGKIPRRPLTAHSAQATVRSEEHTSELQSLMRRSSAVFCL